MTFYITDSFPQDGLQDLIFRMAMTPQREISPRWTTKCFVVSTSACKGPLSVGSTKNCDTNDTVESSGYNCIVPVVITVVITGLTALLVIAVKKCLRKCLRIVQRLRKSPSRTPVNQNL